MVVVWGSRLYGRVDAIPGLGYVATQFGHFDYIPLIPMGSHFVLAQDGDAWRGIRVPLSGKSVLIAWLRTLLVLAAIVGALVTLIISLNPRGKSMEWLPWAGTCAGALLACVLAWRLKMITTASYERACELGKLIELNDEGWEVLDRMYGRAPQIRPGAPPRVPVPDRMQQE
jgi:hypothetical protein